MDVAVPKPPPPEWLLLLLLLLVLLLLPLLFPLVLLLLLLLLLLLFANVANNADVPNEYRSYFNGLLLLEDESNNSVDMEYI